MDPKIDPALCRYKCVAIFPVSTVSLIILPTDLHKGPNRGCPTPGNRELKKEYDFPELWHFLSIFDIKIGLLGQAVVCNVFGPAVRSVLAEYQPVARHMSPIRAHFYFVAAFPKRIVINRSINGYMVGGTDPGNTSNGFVHPFYEELTNSEPPSFYSSLKQGSFLGAHGFQLVRVPSSLYVYPFIAIPTVWGDNESTKNNAIVF